MCHKLPVIKCEAVPANEDNGKLFKYGSLQHFKTLQEARRRQNSSVVEGELVEVEENSKTYRC